PSHHRNAGGPDANVDSQSAFRFYCLRSSGQHRQGRSPGQDRRLRQNDSMRHLPRRRPARSGRSASACGLAARLSGPAADLHAERSERRNRGGPDEESGRESDRRRHHLDLGISGIVTASLTSQAERAVLKEEEACHMQAEFAMRWALRWWRPSSCLLREYSPPATPILIPRRIPITLMKG